MSDKKYKVIVSDRTKRMLGTHIRFMAQVNKDAAKAKKQELMEAMRSLERMPQRFPFFEEAYMPTNKYHKPEIGIVLLTEKFGREFPELIDEIKLERKMPLLIEIPDRHGTGRKKDFIDRKSVV